MKSIEHPSGGARRRARSNGARSREGACALSGCTLIALLYGLLGTTPAWAQAGPPSDWNSVATRIETDGSLGPAQSLAPAGGIYTVGEDLGSRAGTNLFHSFLYFDLGSGDTARFTASNPTDVTNILVFGTAFAVEPKGKRPTFWGT